MHKNVTLSLESGRTVTLRQGLIKDQMNAAALIDPTHQKNNMAGALAVIYQLVRLRIVKIDGKPVKQSELSDLDSLFTPKEFKQIQKFMEEEEESEDVKLPQVTFENSSGEK